MKIILALFCAALSWQAMAQQPIIRDSLQNLNSNFHFQLTTVTQHKYKINAPYTGLKSLTGPAESATTLTATIFWGSKLWKHAALYINPEIAGGSGVSSAQGIAGFTNGEAFRVGNPSPTVYLARIFIQQTFHLGGEQVSVGGGANEVYKKKARKYIDLVVGKFSVADYFDKNSYSHDPRSQFFNWGLMSNGAWDYPANVRGYTWGVVVEYGTPHYSLRAASTMVASEANGNTMDKNYAQANSNVIEFEKPYLLNKLPGKIRILGFYTRARMGNYLQAIKENPTNPDIMLTRAYGRTKYGFGINLEQSLTHNIGLFARVGWNDGHNETWSFTEIDRSASIGIFVDGAQWKRMNDQFGFGSVVNGLSSYHRDYLATGGYGFIIGDGQLNYSREWITEIFYRANLFSDTFYATPNFQFVLNPAYNKDRGPATLIGLRVHVEF
jgi:high affinity Mn2+ porin